MLAHCHAFVYCLYLHKLTRYCWAYQAASEAEDIRLAALKEEVARSEAEIAEVGRRLLLGMILLPAHGRRAGVVLSGGFIQMLI